MEKDFKYSALLDIYSGLLTEKQVEALDYYYNKDYSLAEISELMNITRQGVRDFIKRGESALDEAEEKLGLRRRFMRLAKIGRLANEIRQKSLIDSEVYALADNIINEIDSIQNGEI